ncbi:YphA family membrane protein [Neobacillus sp. SM06]|uniref:YphA family membrane protein n=1 Tax=Neobacillus sp. SM06 TaxID=3422492 RepID=UPI003D26FE22
MEGSMFYFLFWCSWIYITFIMKKENPFRTKLAAAVLIVIILADFSIPIGNNKVYAGGLFLLIITYMAAKKVKGKSLAYFFICSFIILIAYVTFHLFELFDPVWLILKKEWMMGIILGYLAILLQKNIWGRLFILISGTMQGEILYAFILSKYGFGYPIAGLAYLDSFSLTAVLLILWSGMENFSVLFERHINVAERGKEKSS